MQKFLPKHVCKIPNHCRIFKTYTSKCIDEYRFKLVIQLKGCEKVGWLSSKFNSVHLLRKQKITLSATVSADADNQLEAKPKPIARRYFPALGAGHK